MVAGESMETWQNFVMGHWDISPNQPSLTEPGRSITFLGGSVYHTVQAYGASIF